MKQNQPIKICFVKPNIKWKWNAFLNFKNSSQKVISPYRLLPGKAAESTPNYLHLEQCFPQRIWLKMVKQLCQKRFDTRITVFLFNNKCSMLHKPTFFPKSLDKNLHQSHKFYRTKIIFCICNKLWWFFKFQTSEAFTEKQILLWFNSF